VGETVTEFEALNTDLPIIDDTVKELLFADPDVGFGHVFDFYTPAQEYFTLLEVFNFDLTEGLTLGRLGTLSGISAPFLDLENVNHRRKLGDLLESEYNLALEADWDLNRYLPEIWSLLHEDFQVNEYLPKFQLLLGLPFVPKMDEIRSDIKSHFGSSPNLKGLLDYIRTVTLDPLYRDFEGRNSAEPFTLSGTYFPDTQEVRIDFIADATRVMDAAVDLNKLFADQLGDAGISIDSEMAFNLELGLMLDFSIGMDLGQTGLPTGEDGFVSVRQASVTVQVNEDIGNLGVSVEDIPGSVFAVSKGRFDFDSRIELVFHGLDPPTLETSGSLSIALPVASDNPIQPTFYINIQSNNIFDPTSLDLTVVLESGSLYKFVVARGLFSSGPNSPWLLTSAAGSTGLPSRSPTSLEEFSPKPRGIPFM
jgi:hypothetical protein